MYHGRPTTWWERMKTHIRCAAETHISGAECSPVQLALLQLGLGLMQPIINNDLGRVESLICTLAVARLQLFRVHDESVRRIEEQELRAMPRRRRRPCAPLPRAARRRRLRPSSRPVAGVLHHAYATAGRIMRAGCFFFLTVSFFD